MRFVREKSGRTDENPATPVAEKAEDKRRKPEPDNEYAQEHVVKLSSPVSSLPIR